MFNLRDGTSLVLWPRTIVAHHRELAPAFIDRELHAEMEGLALGHLDSVSSKAKEQLGEHLVDAPASSGASPIGLKWLRDLDSRYLGWSPDRDRAQDELEDLESMQGRRRLVDVSDGIYPSLPASTAQCAHLLAELGATQIYLEDDLDGLAVRLAVNSQISVVASTGYGREFLLREAARAGVEARLRVVETPDVGTCDLAVVHTGTPGGLRAGLARAWRATRPGSTIAILVRAPWDADAYALAQGLRMPGGAYHRDVVHWLVAGTGVVDGACDLVLFGRPESPDVPDSRVSLAKQRRAAPYLARDLTGLVLERLEGEPLTRFADLLGRLAPGIEASRAVIQRADRELLWWYDLSGAGLSAALEPKLGRLAMTLMPYDAQLEYAAICAAVQTLGGADTRVRPIRTRCASGENVLA